MSDASDRDDADPPVAPPSVAPGGAPDVAPGGAPDGRAGEPVTIELRWGGPLVVRGPLVIELADGTIARRGTHAALCRCGYSRNKPFCDGSHTGVGFRGD